MYSLNRHIVDVQRNVSGTKPHYEEDMKKFTIYATPAKLITVSRIPFLSSNYSNLKEIEWKESKQYVIITYNAINTITNTVETDKLNFPMIGKYVKNVPLTVFEFFAIGGNPSGVFRLGKKLVPIRYFAEPLKFLGIHEKGQVSPSHPVNIIELPKNANIVSGTIVNQIPPLIVDATLENVKWLECESENSKSKYNIALPNISLYPMVKWP